MELNIECLSGEDLDRAVANALNELRPNPLDEVEIKPYSTDPTAAYSIICDFEISIAFNNHLLRGNNVCKASMESFTIWAGTAKCVSYGPTPLIAAMRCFVKAVRGAS